MAKKAKPATTRTLVAAETRTFVIVAIWVAVLALGVFLPGAFNRWFLPKELVFLGAVLIGSFAVPAGRVARPVWVAIGVGGLVLVVAALTSAQPVAALFGRWPRYEGLVSLPVMVAAVWLGARLLGPLAGASRRLAWHRSISTLAIGIAAFALLDAMEVSPISSDLERSGSLLGNASDQGIVSAVLASLLLPRLISMVAGRAVRRDLIWVALGLLASIVGVVLSASRAGLLALVVGIVAAVAACLLVRWRVVAPSARGKVVLRTAWVGAATVAALVVMVLVTPLTRSRLFGASELATATVADRWLIWGETLEVLRGSPLLGVGPSGFVDAIAVQHGPEWFATVGRGTVLDSPHNLLLQAAMAGGWLLFLIAVALLVVIVLVGVRSMRGVLPGSPQRRGKDRASSEAVPVAAPLDHREMVAGAAAGLCALAVGLLTHFTSPATGILAGLLIGVACSGLPEQPLARVWRNARTTLLSVWLLVFALITSAEYALASAVRAGSAEEAQEAFSVAQALRPWDGDVASIAAQVFAERADAGATGAGEYGVRWAEAALTKIPGSLTTSLALAVSQRASGDLNGAEETLQGLHEQQPHDPIIRKQLAMTLSQLGETAQAEALLSQLSR